ncbi:MAG: hypothetical protein QNJ64_05755 [Crocosphaera sp.]|nr:hypothetical protein [Crocosphaera sp.]
MIGLKIRDDSQRELKSLTIKELSVASSLNHQWFNPPTVHLISELDYQLGTDKFTPQ